MSNTTKDNKACQAFKVPTVMEIELDYRDYIERVITWKMQNRSLINQDLVYNEVIKTYEKRYESSELQFKYGIPSLKKYLQKIIFSRCNDSYKKIPKIEKPISHREAQRRRKFESIMAEAEIREAFATAKITWKDIDYPLMFLLRLEGKKIKEIAEIFGITTGQIKGRLERMKKKLREDPRLIRLYQKKFKIF